MSTSGGEREHDAEVSPRAVEAVRERVISGAAHAVTAGEFYDLLCRAAVETGWASGATVVHAGGPARKVLAAAGVVPRERDEAGGTRIWEADETVRHAIDTGAVVFGPTRRVAPPEGDTSPTAPSPFTVVALPFVVDGKVVAVAHVESSPSAPYVSAEEGCLREIATIGSVVLERCLALERLAAAEEALEFRNRAIGAVSEGILIADARSGEYPVLFASPSFERMFEMAPGEILGQNCRILQGPDTDPATVTQIREALVRGERCTVEILNYRKGGEAFWNELTISPVRDASGTLTSFIGVQRDVTERKRLASQLLQAQKMEAIGVLAGGIAHDFNNMLMVIRGYSASLMRQIKEPELRKHAEQIDQAAVHAADFTRQLLAYSRQQALTPQLIDLNDVVGRMLRLLTRMMGEDITITTDFSPDVHPVRLDRGQIEQALLNIAANARDAMPDGGEFSVHTSEVVLDDGYARLHEEIEPGPHVLLEISDTGVGMDVDTQRRVFDPYFSTKPHGTGLGLATVYGIVRQSGGHIWLYSEPGIGSTFKLYFPAIDAVPVMLDDSPPTPGTVGGDETILVVEDDDGVRPVVAAALRSGGYLVLEASSGQRALNLIDQIDIPIDLLLTDVVMPEMNGRELASRVVARVPGVKVIFTSGYPADESVRRGIADATAEFLEKPYSPVDLARKVRAVLDTPRTPEEERPAER